MKYENGPNPAACRHVLAVTAAEGKLSTVIMRACPAARAGSITVQGRQIDMKPALSPVNVHPACDLRLPDHDMSNICCRDTALIERCTRCGVAAA